MFISLKLKKEGSFLRSSYQEEISVTYYSIFLLGVV